MNGCRRARVLVVAFVATSPTCAHEDAGVFPPPCAMACSDDDPCTDSVCVEDGTCVHLPANVRDACTTDHHCDDDDACTLESCEPVAGCGFSRCARLRAACDDGDPCTSDRCDPALGCVFERLDHGHECVVGAGDCDDGNACTDDVCRPVEGCGFARCESTEVEDDCSPCTETADCGAPCHAVGCVEGRCVYGPPDPRCDYRCIAAGSAALDVSGEVHFRGVAAPSLTTCPNAACTCERELVLSGGGARLALVVGDGAAWGACTVDTCGGDTTCAQLEVGRGYLVSGARQGPRPEATDHETGDALALWVDYYCLATNADLMVGRWAGTFTLGEERVVVAFEARVEPVGPLATRTTFVIDQASSESILTIPAQTFTLPSPSIRLDVTLETSLGRFTGALFSGPFALDGDLHSDDAGGATLRLQPAR